MSGGLAVPPGLRNDPEVKALLAELDQIFEANPLQAYNHPALPKVHHKQLQFHAATTRIKGIIAGNRCGKTIGCVVDDLIQAVDPGCLPEHLTPYKKWQPPFRCWIGAPKYAKHEDTILPLIRKFCPRDQLVGDSFDKAYKTQERILRFKNGSTFGFKTYDQDVDAWASAELERVHWDEEPEGDHGYTIRSEGRARLVSTGGDEIIGMTPLFGYSWVYDKIWERRHDPGITVVQMRMEDNPWLSAEMIEEFAAELTEDERRARVLGEFVHFGGLVYHMFGDRHVVPQPEKGHLKGQDIAVSIDPGIRTTAVVFGAFDADNHLLIFDELYLHNEDAIPENVAKAIRNRLAYWEVQPEFYVIDPAGRNRELGTGENVISAYARAGIDCMPGQHDVQAGVFEVMRRLEADPPAFLVTENCTTWLWERERYRIDPKEDGSFAVLKRDDHLLDASRYLAMARTWWQAQEPAAKPPSFQPDFQIPYSEEHFVQETSPMGAFS